MALLLLGTLAAAALVRPPNAMGLLYCGADETRTDATVLGLGLGGTPLPAPVDGVVTGWRVTGGGSKGQLEQRLQVFRRVDGPVNSLLAVGESSAELAPDGPRHVFKTRIPVESGDLFALRGTTKTFVCDDAAGVTSGLHEGTTTIGSTYAFKAEEGLAVPLDVVIEPDEDGDGYGDETQDPCTRMPTTQDGCPTINLHVKDATVRERSILFRVRVGTKAKVRVIGQVAVGFTRPEQGIEGVSLFSLDSGVKNVSPGRTARLATKLPEPLLQRLDGMSPHKSLKAKISVSSLSVAGREVEHKLTVQLPGRKSS
jgi:hypothetical protein